EKEHVAGRQRGDERFLRIDSGRIGPGGRNDVRACARRDDGAAVERPFVRAVVLALGEVALAGASPADGGGVAAHDPAPYTRAQIKRRMTLPHTTILMTSPDRVR